MAQVHTGADAKRQFKPLQGQEPEWHAYITNLRNGNKSLRALKEELDKRAM